MTAGRSSTPDRCFTCPWCQAAVANGESCPGCGSDGPSLPPKGRSSASSDATISNCGTYRYTLMRRWQAGVPLRFVMLNPSTADATLDDPTIRRCVGFAKREGFAAAIVLNLYAYRATDPKALLACDNAIGPDNNAHLQNHLFSASQGPTPVVAAWGVNAQPGRAQQVLGLVPDVDWRCLGTTKDGHPRHPLYVRGDQPLVAFGATPDARNGAG